MSKWARVNLEEDTQVLEIINYDPNDVINETFLPLFVKCPDEVEIGYFYNPKTEKFYLPDGYAKHPNFETFGYVPIANYEVDENGFIIIPPPPKYIFEEEFRSELSLPEKVLWDNPESGTTQQSSIINTSKKEFPLLASSESTLELFQLLESSKIISVGKSTVLYNKFNQ